MSLRRSFAFCHPKAMPVILTTDKNATFARVDRVAQALHEGGVAEQKAAAGRRLLRLDGPHHKAGGADALKIQVAAEIVGARPQRGERRLQPLQQLSCI